MKKKASLFLLEVSLPPSPPSPQTNTAIKATSHPSLDFLYARWTNKRQKSYPFLLCHISTELQVKVSVITGDLNKLCYIKFEFKTIGAAMEFFTLFLYTSGNPKTEEEEGKGDFSLYI